MWPKCLVNVLNLRRLALWFICIFPPTFSFFFFFIHTGVCVSCDCLQRTGIRHTEDLRKVWLKIIERNKAFNKEIMKSVKPKKWLKVSHPVRNATFCNSQKMYLLHAHITVFFLKLFSHEYLHNMYLMHHIPEPIPFKFLLYTQMEVLKHTIFQMATRNSMHTVFMNTSLVIPRNPQSITGPS